MSLLEFAAMDEMEKKVNEQMEEEDVVACTFSVSSGLPSDNSEWHSSRRQQLRERRDGFHSLQQSCTFFSLVPSTLETLRFENGSKKKKKRECEEEERGERV